MAASTCEAGAYSFRATLINVVNDSQPAVEAESLSVHNEKCSIDGRLNSSDKYCNDGSMDDGIQILSSLG